MHRFGLMGRVIMQISQSGLGCGFHRSNLPFPFCLAASSAAAASEPRIASGVSVKVSPMPLADVLTKSSLALFELPPGDFFPPVPPRRSCLLFFPILLVLRKIPENEHVVLVF